MVAVGDLVAAFAVTGTVGASLAAWEAVQRRTGMEREVVRKYAHAMSCTLCAAGVFFVNSWEAVSAMSLAAAGLLVVVVERQMLPGLLHAGRARDYGIVLSAVALAVVVWLFWPNRPVIAGALLILALADPLAAWVGGQWGRHRVRAWNSNRSLEGGAAFLVASFLISLVVLGHAAGGPPGAREVALAAFIAVTAACVELMVPSALDNLAVTVWAAFFLDIAVRTDAGDAARWAGAMVASGGAAVAFFKLGWLDAAGAVGSVLVSAPAVALGGWSWILPIAAFFASSSILTKFAQADARARGPRNLRQVLINGAFPLLPPVLVYAVTGNAVWFQIAAGGSAAANADTWATEVGRLAPRPPFFLRTLRPVPAGTSGAVSYLGMTAMLLGAVVIGVVAALASNPRALLPVTLAGIGGALFDSALGAWGQARFRCPACHRVGETREHCRVGGQVASGIPWLDNDLVNLAANLCGMLIVVALAATGR